MNNIRKEKKIYNFQSSDNKLPAICFRYSKDSIISKTSVRFMHPSRAEIYVHLQGDGVFFVGDTMYRLKEGDILIYNKDEIHFSTIETNTSWERYVLFFSPDYFNFLDDVPENLLNFYYERKKYQDNYIRLPEGKRKKLLHLLAETNGYVGSNDFDQNLQLFKAFLEILQLVNYGYLHPNTSPREDVTPKIVNEIISYVNKNIQHDITLASIADHANISKSYLSTLFKKYIGVSPYEYLLTVRLECAKQKLANGENIADACSASGFGDYSHFIQFFKKRVGITPYQYRKRYMSQ